MTHKVIAMDTNKLLHVMTVDAEDWHHGLGRVANGIPRDLGHFRVSMDLLLDLFDKHDTKATIFFVASLARSCPDTVMKAKARGHEIGNHSLMHIHPSTQTEKQFLSEIRESKNMLEDILGDRVESFRAPWLELHKMRYPVLDILVNNGYLYDSSDSRLTSLEPWKLPVDRVSCLYHVPVTRLPFFNFSYPAGGGYLRIFPQAMVWHAMQILCHRNVPMTIYIHPYDINADHPRLPKLFFETLKRNIGRDCFLNKLDFMLLQMDFTTIKNAVAYYENINSIKANGT